MPTATAAKKKTTTKKTVTVKKTAKTAKEATKKIRVSPKYKGKRGAYSYFQTVDKNIMVPFGEIFGDINHKYEEFRIPLAQKKIFGMITNIIVTDNNTLLSYNKDVAIEVMYQYLCLKAHIDSWGSDKNSKRVGPNILINQLTNLFTSHTINSVEYGLMKMIIEFVDINYKGDANKSIDEASHKFDMSTTFRDEHYKDLCCVSTMLKLVVPICTHYVHNHPEVNAKDFFDELAKKLFDIVESITGRKTYSKLHTYISRMVETAQKIDQPMWNRTSILSRTLELKIEEISSKVITTIIPQIQLGGNIRGYLASVIRNSARYTVRQHDPFTIHSFTDCDGKMGDDDSILTEVEMFESYINRPNEELRLFRKIASFDTMQKIMIRNDAVVTYEEFVWYKNTVKTHDLQRNLIFQSFASYYGSTENMYDCNRSTYVHLMIILKKMFERRGLNLLSNYLSSHNEAFNHRRTRKPIERKVLENPTYVNLIDSKYHHIKGILNRKNFINNDIMKLINNDFRVNEMGNPKNGTIIPVDEDAIIENVLRFYTMMIV